MFEKVFDFDSIMSTLYYIIYYTLQYYILIYYFFSKFNFDLWEKKFFLKDV